MVSHLGHSGQVNYSQISGMHRTNNLAASDSRMKIRKYLSNPDTVNEREDHLRNGYPNYGSDGGGITVIL